MSESDTLSRASNEEMSIAEQFVRARLEARPLAQYPGAIPANLASAYRCQDIAISRWPERIGGWKVTAHLPPALQAQCGDQRMIGPVFTPNIRNASAGQAIDCPVFADGFAAFEPEIVIRVGENAPLNKLVWTIDEASDMVGELCIGVEIASSPLPTLLSLGVLALASDFGANYGIVVGSPISDWRTRKEITAQCFIDDQLDGSGVTSLREGPLAALAFVLGSSARRGRPLHAGATITTGTITRAHHVRPGQCAKFVYAGFGEVLCRAVQANPLS